MSDASRRKITTTSIHIMALDGIVNVNSLFTLALFLGITSTNTNANANLVGGDTACVAGASISESLITYHVYSFSSFLFSSLIALALKQAINISKGAEEADALGVTGFVRNVAVSFVVKVDILALRMGILVSAFGSVFGCAFLVMALVDLVQIKLGTLGCGSHYTFAAVAPLLFLVPMALIIYIFLVLYAFTR
ncbi:protein maternal effect embryo arrest 60 [Senna tora]|uniref:Protein maternal effect embryo arrest 60 n=1 Tax=Senna tora TaxID=362788 RepID=A0A834SJL0_9FABA|nr:protein maternal effect embryo arrest 60 [Senna tora]